MTRRWLAARRDLLAREKEFTRARDRLSSERRALPWQRIEREYSFDGRSLVDLFDGRRQLVVYHFMFPPAGEPCKHCSFWADSFDPVVVHLRALDTNLVAVSRASQAEIDAYRKRMGWTFTWVSSDDGDFNYDFGASFRAGEETEPVYNFGTLVPGRADREGATVFYRDDDGVIYRTYSTHARGIDLLNTAYNYLDLVPLGRNENEEFTQSWVRRHDEYDD
jgi:predicted dithiol-disulfide oxidoreductase (DUF899 family)